jgi:hypothetical protein
MKENCRRFDALISHSHTNPLMALGLVSCFWKVFVFGRIQNSAAQSVAVLRPQKTLK